MLVNNKTSLLQKRMMLDKEDLVGEKISSLISNLQILVLACVIIMMSVLIFDLAKQMIISKANNAIVYNPTASEKENFTLRVDF